MINIQDIIPFMKNGWVSMDRDKRWHWHKNKPSLSLSIGIFMVKDNLHDYCSLDAFNIEPVKNWTRSLIKIEDKDDDTN